MKIQTNLTNSPFIPLVSDYGFKAVFANERNELFLRRALQALIKTSTPIISITFDKNAFDGIVKDSRGGVYDLACIDEQGNHFIVEMQLSDAPYFFHRLKFYAFHKFNSMVLKGDYEYDNLTKIYCIGILANNIFSHNDFHTIGTIKNEAGQLLDDQITYVTIELDKFLKTADEVENDLDKLLYTMKTVHTITEPTQYPQFWTEEWLKKAIDELDKRKLTPDERFAYERTLAINAESIRVTNKIIKDGIEEGVREEIQKAVQEAVQKTRQEAVQQQDKALQERNRQVVERILTQGKLSVGEIADMLAVSPDFVRSIQTELGL